MNATWSELILIPAANTRGYELIYAAENWLRRMVLTALMVTHGPTWDLAIDNRLRTQLMKQSKWNAARWYLGVDSWGGAVARLRAGEAHQAPVQLHAIGVVARGFTLARERTDPSQHISVDGHGRVRIVGEGSGHVVSPSLRDELLNLARVQSSAR